MSDHEHPEGEQDAVDDPFAHLFRPDPFADDPVESKAPLASPEAADPLADWEPLIAVPTAAQVDPPLPPASAAPVAEVVEDISEESVEVEAEPTPLPPADPLVGRLFRSRGAPERPDTVTALGAMQARRLRTMARADEQTPAPAPVEEVAAAVAEEDLALAQPAPLPVSSSGEPAPALQVMARPPASPQVPDDEREDNRRPSDRGTSGSLTALGVYAVTTGVTVILAFGQVLFFGGTIGAIAGIGLLVVSIFAAFAVRVSDSLNAIFAPPIAFLIATLTAGQVGVNANGVSGRAVEVFFLLGANWIWVIGSTVAALVIVALRRRLS